MTARTVLAPASRGGWIKAARGWCRRTLFTPITPVWVHALRVFALSYGPMILLTAVVAAVLALGEFSFPLRLRPPTWQRTLLAVVVAPVVETVVLAVLVTLLRLRIRSATKVALLVGLVAGLLHAVESPARFFGPAYGFMIFAYAYQTWATHSLWRAYVVASIPHALGNGVTFTLLWWSAAA